MYEIGHTLGSSSALIASVLNPIGWSSDRDITGFPWLEDAKKFETEVALLKKQLKNMESDRRSFVIWPIDMKFCI